jgi:hypothetical protein
VRRNHAGQAGHDARNDDSHVVAAFLVSEGDESLIRVDWVGRWRWQRRST